MPTTTHTFQVDGMHCGSCPLLIDETLEDMPGVTSAATSLRAGRATVELDTDQTTPADVIAAITELGYRAETA